MRKVLLVEDDPGSARLMTHVVRRGGFEILVADTGEKAVDLACSEHPDLILMDIGLPGIDGYEATRRIRVVGCTAPIVAVTSNAMSGDRERALELGFNGYIEKPYDPMTVMDVILKIARGI